jgi:hypothetical protein
MRHKVFYGLMAGAGVSIYADIHSTEGLFYRCPTCREANFHIFGGRRPSSGQLWANDAIVAVPYQVLNWYLIREDENESSKGGKILAAANTAAFSAWHFHGYVHNNGLAQGATHGK